jgi:starch synthase
MASKPINVLYVTSESLPYIRIQSLGDISFSFVMAMREQGVDIRLTMPRYGVISERRNQIHYIKRLTDIEIPIGKESYPASIKSSSMNSPRTKVQAYITTNDYYFSSRKGVYRDFKNLELYPDNNERFLYFCRSVVETCTLLEWVPDVIHCVDGETALLPALFKLLYPEKFEKTKFVLSIHNIEEQYISGKSFFEKTCLPKEFKDVFIHQNKFNFLKAGITNSDVVVFSNKRYFDAIMQKPELSGGLSQYLKDKEVQILPIGIDPWSWDPKKDKQIAYKLTDEFEEFKYDNKVALCQKFNVDYDPSIPIFGLVLDVNEYQAIEYFIENAPQIFKNENLMIFALARVETRYKNTLNLLSKKYKKSFKVLFTNDLQNFHQLYAGSDFYLSLDNHDPTHLNLMYAAKYGSLPVANDFHIDTNVIKPFEGKKGFALLFNRNKVAEFYNAIGKAIKIFEDKDTFNTLIQNASSQKFSWEPIAKEFKSLYTKLIKGK